MQGRGALAALQRASGAAARLPAAVLSIQSRGWGREGKTETVILQKLLLLQAGAALGPFQC